MKPAKQIHTITNFWKTVHLRCENPTCLEKHQAFDLVRGSEEHEPYYKCPECGAIVPYFLVESFVYSLMDSILEDENEGIEPNLTYTKATKKDPDTGRLYQMAVVSHRPGKIKVLISESIS